MMILTVMFILTITRLVLGELNNAHKGGGRPVYRSVIMIGGGYWQWNCSETEQFPQFFGFQPAKLPFNKGGAAAFEQSPPDYYSGIIIDDLQGEKNESKNHDE
jgi:hypothetical protein